MQYKRSRWSLASALTALALLAACSDSPTGTSAGEPEDAGKKQPEPTVPTQPSTGKPFYTGAFLGDANSTPERIGPAIREFAELSGKAPSLVKTFHDLNVDFTAAGWAGQLLRAVDGAGATNYLAIDVRWSGAPATGLLDAIVAGKADARLAALARGIASLGKTVLLEPAWEMNGNWHFAWQGAENGGAAGPARYVAAWRRMVDVFRREGAGNVRWVFNPNVGNPFTHAATGEAHWNWYGHYYPGDAYVDYVGAHGFNAPRVWGGAWQSFQAMVDGDAADRMLSDLTARYPSKPILIGEFGSDEGSGDAKGRWIRDAYATMRAHPNVVGAVWFHMNKEADWRINSSAASLTAFREAMSVPGIQTAFVPVAPSRSLLASR